VVANEQKFLWAQIRFGRFQKEKNFLRTGIRTPDRPTRSIVITRITTCHIMNCVWTFINKNEVKSDYINNEGNGNHVEESLVMRVVETRLQGRTLCHKFGCSSAKFRVLNCNEDRRSGNGMWQLICVTYKLIVLRLRGEYGSRDFYC
jgi:hypothetical protein